MTRQRTFKAKLFSYVARHASYHVGIVVMGREITAFDAFKQPNVNVCAEEILKAPIRQKKAILSDFLNMVRTVVNMFKEDYGIK